MVKAFIQKFFEFFGFNLVKSQSLVKLIENQRDLVDYLSRNNIKKFYRYTQIYPDICQLSKSQIYQDLFVLFQTNFKKHGFFVEFGATDGLRYSNSYVLEKSFGWNGILAEPARCWHNDLIENRDCHIDTLCVWSRSGQKLTFLEVENGENSSAELSGVANPSSFFGVDRHSKNTNTVVVETISLTDLLRKYDAPRCIDYLSIDTEGSEYTILKSFDFSEYDIKIITVEHNFSKNRALIYDHLVNNGYVRVHEELSQFDDWYVKSK